MFRRRVLISALAAIAATSVAWLGLPTPSAHAASASTVNRLADPDTVVAKSGSYVTYGTSTGAQNVGECNTAGAKVPYIVHGSGETPGMGACISGDAMPGGPGAWAEGAIWAPGVTRIGDRFVMYYTASKAGTGQKCIGRAWSGAATGPFTGQAEWACPGAGRWAIDADPFVANGNLFVAYRDDAVASGAETGLSAVRVNNDTGFADWSTRRTLLRSTNVDWETRGTSGGTHVIENPSMWREPNGTWYVMYSGNNWDSDRYAVGIANCGTSPLAGGTCTPIDQGVNRPYFGFTGSTGINPVKGLPGNHAGPGGMSVFQTPSGEHKVVWHWWTGSNRRVMTGTLVKGSGDSFSVT